MVIDQSTQIILEDYELRARARRILLVLTDNDGVLTDNGVYYSDAGEVMKRYSVRDGMGVAVLRKEGIETGIISGEHSPSLLRRAEKLRITLCRLGVADKKVELATVLAIAQLNPEQIAYIGDDINDLGIIDTIRSYGLTGAPADAMPIVKRSVHFIASVQGGHGAFRDFAEWIISLRNGHKEHTAYQPVLSPYAQELI